MALHLANDNIWVDKKRFDAAECQYYESLAKDIINNKTDKKCELNCNGNVELVVEKNVVNDSNVKSKKGGSGTKNKANQSVVSPTACVQQPEVTGETPVKPKKNKKKNKSQNALKNNLATTAECGIKQGNNQNSNKSVDLPQSKNKKNSWLQGQKRGTSSNNHCTLVSEIAKAREHIKNSLEKMDGITTLSAAPASSELYDRLAVVEKENAELKKLVENLKNLVLDSQNRVAALESQLGKSATKVTEPKKSEAEDDDGVDLFASESEEENEEATRIREERLAAYAAKKSKKPALIAKSSLVLDVKPWDDETDLNIMESEIRKIVSDGLLWGASKFVPVAFGIKKLSISCVVEDDKVSIDWLTEEIEKLEDYVQSVDVAAFNKI